MPTVSELGQRVKLKYPGSYDDLPDDELGRRIKAKYPGSYDDFADSAPIPTSPAPARAARDTGMQDRIGALAWQAAMGALPGGTPGGPGVTAPSRERVLSTLPSVGGFVGGLAGIIGGLGPGSVPLGIGGAAAGGAAGEAAREALSGQELDPGRIATTGAVEGGLQAVGGLLAKGAGAVAGPMMRRALGTGKAIMSEFPDVAETALKRGIPVSAGGAAKAKALREGSAEALQSLLSETMASGKMLNTRAVTKHVRTLLRSNVIPEREKSAIVTELVEFLGDKSARIDPLLLREVKQYYQNKAASAYRAARIGGMSEAQAPRAAFAKALARGAREQLETIPGVARQEANTQSLIGVERAVRNAVTRPPRPFELNRPGTYPLPLVGSPHVLSRVALTMNSPMFKSLLRQSPRAAAALVQDLMETAEPDALGQ